MAIAPDGSSDGGISVGSNTLTWSSHSVAGSNRAGVVIGFGGIATDNWTGVTWGGSAMTLVKKGVPATGGRYLYMYAIANPATGVSTITVTASGSPDALGAVEDSYTGMSSTFPDSSNSNASASTTNLTVSTTVVAANSWLVMGGTASAGAVSAGTGATLRQNWATNSRMALFDSNGTVGTGSQSMTMNTGVADIANVVIASFAPSGAAPTGNSNFFF